MDDNIINLIPLQVLLSNLGIKSKLASGGQEAIDLFIKDREKKCCNVKFQLVLMDLNMP